MTYNPVIPILQNMIFFKSIHILTSDEYNRIKKKISEYLEILEDITINGYFGTQKAVCQVYLSDLHFNSEFHFLSSEKSSYSSVQMYMLGRFVSYDEESNNQIYKWYKELREVSDLITQSNLNKRVKFFERQYAALKHF